MIANSYTVLFASIFAHLCQFAFLFLVENPHIDKTYNLVGPEKDDTREILQLYFRRDLIVFKNFDLYRSSDLFSIAIALQAVVLAFVIGPIDQNWKLYFYIGFVFFLFAYYGTNESRQALFWRLVHTFGLGLILRWQSNHNTWTKHFIKHGETTRDAFNHWKVYVL